MNLNGVDIDRLRLLNGECLVQIHSITEDEIQFNGGTLKLVNSLKDSIEDVNPNEIYDLLKSMRKSNYKDTNAIKKYHELYANQQKQSDENAGDVAAKQAVRRGVIVALPEKDLGFAGWDFDCEFDAIIGDEVWFDSMYTRTRIEEGDGAIDIDGKKYITVPTHSIYAAKRNGEIISLNGYIIGKRLPNDRKIGSFFLPESKIARVEVVVPPSREPEYVHSEFFKNTSVKKGDVVCMKEHFATKLDSTMAESTDLVRFQSRAILAIEE